MIITEAIVNVLAIAEPSLLDLCSSMASQGEYTL
jgi:hypothetical protein